MAKPEMIVERLCPWDALQTLQSFAEESLSCQPDGALGIVSASHKQTLVVRAARSSEYLLREQTVYLQANARKLPVCLRDAETMKR